MNSGKLGRLQVVKVKLPVTETTSPEFYRPRQVPDALRENIAEELFDFTKAGIIELITRRNEQEHLSNLGKVLTKLEEAGLRMNKTNASSCNLK